MYYNSRQDEDDECILVDDSDDDPVEGLCNSRGPSTGSIKNISGSTFEVVKDALVTEFAEALQPGERSDLHLHRLAADINWHECLDALGEYSAAQSQALLTKAGTTGSRSA